MLARSWSTDPAAADALLDHIVAQNWIYEEDNISIDYRFSIRPGVGKGWDVESVCESRYEARCHAFLKAHAREQEQPK